MARIAISYRREDSGIITGRVFDRLVAHYGREAIFRDIDDIPLGADFREHIGAVLDQTDIVLAIVGPRWIGRRGNKSRLDNEADPVRVEIEAVLRKGIPLIPVLVMGAAMPNAGSLPETMRDFAYRNGIQVDAGLDFDLHLQRLIRAMDGLFARNADTAAPAIAPAPPSDLTEPPPAASEPSSTATEPPPAARELSSTAMEPEHIAPAVISADLTPQPTETASIASLPEAQNSPVAAGLMLRERTAPENFPEPKPTSAPTRLSRPRSGTLALMAASIGFVVIAVAMVLLYFGLRSAPYNSAHSPQEPASETAASAAAKTEQSSGSASAQASGYAAEAEDFGVVPVVSLRASELHAPTPLSVPGARTITTTDLANRLLARESLVLLYVGDEIEGGGIGMAGARWLKGAGFGTSFDDDIGKRLRRKLNTLSGNNYSAQIVVFCIDPHCWLSYNVVLRLVRIGYRNVSWYRGGITAWHEAQLPLTKLPEESW